MYSFGFNLFLENPLFGIGFNNFQEYFYTGQYSHSDYIESLASTGIVGFILYQGSYFVLLLKSFKLFLRSNPNSNYRFYYAFIIITVILLKFIGLSIILYNSPIVMLIFVSIIFLSNNLPSIIKEK